jgi:SnoaL-like domain
MDSPKRNEIKGRPRVSHGRSSVSSTAIEREEIRRAIAEWALCRDTGRWEKLRSLYAPGATMQTTWFDGSAEEFVDRSAKGFGRTARAQHFVGASVIELGEARAIAETRIVLLLRTTLGLAQVDVTCHGRFFDFFEKQRAKWCICKRLPIYEKDRIDPVDPRERLDIDHHRLSRFAEGYRHVAYVQSLAGADVTKGLIEPGSAEEQNLYREGAKWLAREKGENHDGDTRPH